MENKTNQNLKPHFSRKITDTVYVWGSVDVRCMAPVIRECKITGLRENSGKIQYEVNNAVWYEERLVFSTPELAKETIGIISLKPF